jgi:outer membrane protein assembly factor BamB
MTISQTETRTPRKPLRLWPGVVAVVLLWLARFGVKAVVPGFKGFAWGAQGGILAAVLVVLWWAFLSRARWFERLGGVLLMVAGLGAAWSLRHESMGLAWLLGWALPNLCLAFVAAAVASRHWADGARRATLATAILLACGAWTLVRTEGITGDHVARFAWRWAPTPEERLTAQAAEEPVVPPPPRTAPAAPRDTPPPPAPDPPTPPAAAASPRERPATQPAAAPEAAPPASGADWPGFRGPRRDGAVPGLRIDTSWSTAPPVELWRRPIGPAWSSFAVRGNLVYTQEQRADHEVVACYDLVTGQPVWSHRDVARFFESNAGAGPRGTPAIARGRVYAFGATGILNALDARDGALVWSRDVATDTGAKVPNWGFSSSPLVVDDLVIVAAAGQLAAYDLATGRPRWSGSARRAGYSSPHLVTIGGVAQVLLMSNAGTTSVAPADGTTLWEHPWGGSPIVQPALTADGDVLIAAGADSGTRRLAIAQGSGGWTQEERWTSRGLKPYFNDFVVHGGHAYGFDASILACIDLKDGSRKWKGGRYGNGQLILLPDQDLLLVLSEEGELALVGAAPDRFTEIARFPAIQGKTWNHPVLVRDVLLVRNAEEMAAFRLPLAKPLARLDRPSGSAGQ